MIGAINKAKQLMKNKKMEELERKKAASGTKVDRNDLDQDLNSQDLQEFLELESKTKQPQSNPHTWWYVMPNPKMLESKSKASIGIGRDFGSRSPRQARKETLKESLHDKLFKDRPQTGPSYKRFHDTKKNSSVKNLHVMQSVDGKKRSVDKVRISVAARSEKPSPSSTKQKQVTSRDISGIEAAREETRPSNKPTPRHSQHPGR